MNKKNITYVVKNNLCIECGICYSICPVNSILLSGSLDKKPVVNNDCTECKKCINNCPGLYPIYENTDLIGNIVSCYAGYANNKEIRKLASSGGIITGITSFLLKEKDYAGVICVRQSKEDIYQNEVILATSVKDLLSASGSRYSPTFIGTALKDLPLKKGGKYIYIGKPCDIQALNKFLKLNNNYDFLKIAIFCAYTPSMDATKQIFSYYKVDDKKVTSFGYRGNGWPGFFTSYSGEEVVLKKNYREVWDNILCKLTNIRKRCFLCHDCTGELADISVGDAWLNKYLEKESDGYSLVLTRSELGQGVIEKAMQQKILELNEVDKSEVLDGQSNLLKKKENLFLKRLIARLLFEKVPIERIKVNISMKGLIKIPGLIKYFLIKKIRL